MPAKLPALFFARGQIPNRGVPEPTRYCLQQCNTLLTGLPNIANLVRRAAH